MCRIYEWKCLSCNDVSTYWEHKSKLSHHSMYELTVISNVNWSQLTVIYHTETDDSMETNIYICFKLCGYMQCILNCLAMMTLLFLHKNTDTVRFLTVMSHRDDKPNSKLYNLRNYNGHTRTPYVLQMLCVCDF